MPRTKNGVIKKSAKTIKSSKSLSKDGSNHNRKASLKGFEKKPVVALPRFDITPYLNKMHSKDATHKVRTPANIDENFFKCRINIVREDLNKLKNTWNCDGPRLRKCKICQKVYTDEKKLKNHHDNKHLIVYGPLKPKKKVTFSDDVIVHEFVEYHKCRRCSKMFEDYRKLKTHMRENHKKRKCYVCDYCKKSFVDRSIFKVHIKLHCDICTIFFPTKYQYMQHRREQCKIKKKHKCKTCGIVVFCYMDLREHISDHIVKLFVCDICKEKFHSKCAVAHHISFLHSKQRPTELYQMRNLGSDRLYLCNFCDDSSVEKEIMEKHVEGLPDLTNKAMTGYRDYYFCDQCNEKFEKENELMQHKWTHYLKANDDSKSESQSTIKKTINVNSVPLSMQPKVVLQRLKDDLIENVSKNLTNNYAVSDKTVLNNNNLKHINGVTGEQQNILPLDSLNREDLNKLLTQKKPIVNKARKKALFSRHQCEMCARFFSSNFCLRRHIQKVHSTEDQLRCNECEEIFSWPALLQSHKCIRSFIPNESIFVDANPEIPIDNFNIENVSSAAEFDGINIADDYSGCIDFELPAPIVQASEYNSVVNVKDERNDRTEVNGQVYPVQSFSYKVVMQEVPIEF